MKSIPFSRIARATCRNDVSDCVMSVFSERDNVVLGQISFLAAVSAAIIVSMFKLGPLFVSQVIDNGIVYSSATFAMMLGYSMGIFTFPLSYFGVGLSFIFLVPLPVILSIFSTLCRSHASATKCIDFVFVQRVASASLFSQSFLIYSSIFFSSCKNLLSMFFIMFSTLRRYYLGMSNSSKSLPLSIFLASLCDISCAPFHSIGARFFLILNSPKIPFFRPAFFTRGIKSVATFIGEEIFASGGKAFIASDTSAH